MKRNWTPMIAMAIILGGSFIAGLPTPTFAQNTSNIHAVAVKHKTKAKKVTKATKHAKLTRKAKTFKVSKHSKVTKKTKTLKVSNHAKTKATKKRSSHKK